MSGLGTIDLGRWLFRWRSYTPIPILIVLLAVILESRPTVFAEGDGTQLGVGLGDALALAGEALRFFTWGQSPQGPRGQGTCLAASELHTRAPHPCLPHPSPFATLAYP